MSTKITRKHKDLHEMTMIYISSCLNREIQHANGHNHAKKKWKRGEEHTSMGGARAKGGEEGKRRSRWRQRTAAANGSNGAARKGGEEE